MIATALFAATALAAIGFTLVTLLATMRMLARARRVPDPLSWPDLVVLRPCEGTESELSERLASTLTANYPGRLELIVALGGSPPVSFEALSRRDGFRCVRSADAPISCNRKAWHLSRALQADRGDAPVVLAIDADVEVTRELLCALVRAAMAPGACAAFGPPVQSGDRAASRVGRAALGGGPHCFATLAALARLTGTPPPMVGCAVAIRREALVKIGGFRTALGVIGDDLALGDALSKCGAIGFAAAPVDCRDPALGIRALIAQLARWIRVATAHRPRIAMSYPTLIAPLPLVAAAAVLALPHVGATVALAPLAVLYALRVALAWAIRRSLFGRAAEAVLDPVIGDLAWWAAAAVALAPQPTRWRGRVYRIGRGGRLLAPIGTRPNG